MYRGVEDAYSQSPPVSHTQLQELHLHQVSPVQGPHPLRPPPPLPSPFAPTAAWCGRPTYRSCCGQQASTRAAWRTGAASTSAPSTRASTSAAARNSTRSGTRRRSSLSLSVAAAGVRATAAAVHAAAPAAAAAAAATATVVESDEVDGDECVHACTTLADETLLAMGSHNLASHLPTASTSTTASKVALTAYDRI